MELRQLGTSDLYVTPIALGTWAMGNDAWWGPVDDNESIATIHLAIDSGINLIDTAPIYGLGHSEQIVGKAVQDRRDRVLIATKCGLLPPTNDNGLPRRCLRAESIIRECEASLRRLRTDTIDLYQCHWPDPDTPIEETMQAMQRLLEQGKIRAIGVSNFGCQSLSQARRCGPVHSLQSPYSMLQRDVEDEILPYCIEYRIGFLAYGPLCRGLLTGKFDENTPLTDRARQIDPAFLGDTYRANLRKVRQLADIANRVGRPLSALAINWVIHRPGVTAAIVGAKRPSQLAENLQAIDWTIDPQTGAEIDRLLSS